MEVGKSMKVFYFNDTKENQIIYLKDKFVPNYIIKPMEGRLFEFESPANTIPFIKTWTDQVLITYMNEPLEKND